MALDDRLAKVDGEGTGHDNASYWGQTVRAHGKG
jgi:hypothetical protein